MEGSRGGAGEFFSLGKLSMASAPAQQPISVLLHGSFQVDVHGLRVSPLDLAIYDFTCESCVWPARILILPIALVLTESVAL